MVLIDLSATWDISLDQKNKLLASKICSIKYITYNSIIISQSCFIYVMSLDIMN